MTTLRTTRSIDLKLHDSTNIQIKTSLISEDLQKLPKIYIHGTTFSTFRDHNKSFYAHSAVVNFRNVTSDVDTFLVHAFNCDFGLSAPIRYSTQKMLAFLSHNKQFVLAENGESVDWYPIILFYAPLWEKASDSVSSLHTSSSLYWSKPQSFSLEDLALILCPKIDSITEIFQSSPDLQKIQAATLMAQTLVIGFEKLLESVNLGTSYAAFSAIRA